jgi:hypothetical protein
MIYAQDPSIARRRFLRAARHASTIAVVLAVLAVALPGTGQAYSAYDAELRCPAGEAAFRIDLPLFGTRRFSTFFVRLNRTGVWYTTPWFYTTNYVQKQQRPDGTWFDLNWSTPGAPISYVIGGGVVVEALEDRWSADSYGRVISGSYTRVNLGSCTTSRSYFEPIPMTFP